MKRKRSSKKKKTLSTGVSLTQYRDPLKPGSLGGLTQFAKANDITVQRVREVLQRNLGYTLHKPRQHQFPTLPVMVFGMDEQWMANLIEVINIAKYNRGYDLFRIDKIMKRKGDKVLVRWKGWPVKNDTWLEKSAVLKKSS